MRLQTVTVDEKWSDVLARRLDGWVRRVVDLSTRATVRDNVAHVAHVFTYNSVRAPFALAWPKAQAPRAVAVLKATNGTTRVSFPTVTWEFDELGRVLVQSIDVASEVDHEVDVILVED